MRRAVALLTSVLFVACSHSVIIDSDPSGAEIRVNGEKIGTAPVTYHESTGWERVYDIEATKPGFKTTRKQVKQTEWNVPVTVLSVGPAALTAGVCFPTLIGLFWARQLPDRVVVSMERAGGAPDGTVPPSSYGY